MIRVPPDALAPETLQRLIESFVLREGTDYGPVEYDLASKVAQVKAQLDRGEAAIVFDPSTETATIVLSRELPEEE